MREERDDLAAANGSRKQPKVEVPPGHARYGRQHLPVKVVLQHRRLPARCPGAAAMRALAQSAFVDEDDRPAFVFGLFLTPASAFASTARSFPHPAPGLARWDADSSSPTAAGCAKPVTHGSGLHIPPQSGGPPATPSTNRFRNPVLRARASARARSSSGLRHSGEVCVQRAPLSSNRTAQLPPVAGPSD